MLDVKGVGEHLGVSKENLLGTHKRADTSSEKVTGLLGLADALRLRMHAKCFTCFREMCFQRLIQRLLDLEGLQDIGTVPYYGIIDMGLTYSGVNPATGWRGERCVLLDARRNDRLI